MFAAPAARDRTGMSNRRIIQIVLAIAIAAAAIRAVIVVRGRKGGPAAPAAAKNAPPLNPEYYVTPKKLHLYDLKSAQELTQQAEWIKEGYRYTYYPYNPAQRRADLKDEAGVLGPIQQIQVTSVFAQPTPGDPTTRQVMAAFDLGGKPFAMPIGTERHGDFNIYADEMFYYQDPHKLYDFWPPDIWNAIAQHQVKKGMDELQASMSVGMGQPHRGETEDEKVVIYPNGGHRVTVTYRDGKAAGIVVGNQ